MRRLAPALLFSLAFSLEANTLRVETGAAELRWAINLAAPNDTIEVHPGIYAGNIVLNKPLSIVGIGRPVLRGEGTGSTSARASPTSRSAGR